MRRLHHVAAIVLAFASFSAVAADHIVIARNGPGGRHFDPPTLTIDVNDTVTFKNDVDDLGFHNVQSDNGVVPPFRCAAGCDGDGAGGNGAASADAWSATVTFATAGTVGYYCFIHGTSGGGGMSGVITIVGGAGSPSVIIDPPSISGTAEAGASTSSNLDIANAGDATLDWTLDMAATDCATPATVPWLTTASSSGSVTAAGTPSIVGVTLDAAALAVGVYDANLCLHTNDTAHALVAIPVEFTVTTPDLIFQDGFDG
jgi:plastocyanin